MVYCVGLTGGIATGKSSAAELFSSLGIDIFNADAISRELTTDNQEVLNKIVEHFGKEVLSADGKLNRMRMRDIIFTDPAERNWLECLLHPLIRQQLKELVLKSKSPYCMVEIPLLIDKEAYPYLNKILVVNSLSENQVARVMARDHCSREQALAILNAQPSMDLRLKHADMVLMNNGNLDKLKEQVRQIHQQLLEESQ